MAFAAWLGQFVGAVLAECGPVIVEILKASFRSTAEDSKAPADLRKRLQDAISKAKSGSEEKK